MTALVFVDTNVFLYMVDKADATKHDRARAWRELLWKTRRGRVSFQVLQEFYANVCKKWPREKDAARLEITDLLVWGPVLMDGELLQLGWRLQDRFGFSFWDSLIVAAAKASRCDVLLSEDFQVGQDLDGLEVVNPFLRQPDQI
ncbi:MAG TPA: PIN domain-containing protein [Candidatus Acidoferrum sp.]|jgi:predicted nucleic acid-binding protein